MTTPLAAEFVRGSQGSSGVEIDGFRVRLISADHAD